MCFTRLLQFITGLAAILSLTNALARKDIDIAFHARIQLDAHSYAYPDDANADLETSLFEVRRARLENVGYFYDTMKYKISGEFSSEPKLEDAYVSLEKTNFRVVAGQFYYPFGNETQGSSKYSEFMEKAGITSLVSYGRDRGISIQTHNNRFLFLQTGLVQGRGSNISDNNSSWDRFIRFGVDIKSHEKNENRYVFGFSGATGQQLAAPGESIKIKSESHSELTLFKAGIKENTTYGRSRLSLEALALHNAGMLKWEFFYDHYRFNKSVHVFGYYLIGSYFLTGEQRTLKNGLLSKQHINSPLGNGGKGAWELAFRFSEYSVNPLFYEDDTLYEGWKAVSKTKYAPRAYATTTAINWYPSNTTRVMFNYVLTNTKRDADGAYRPVESAVMLRFQWEI